MGFTGTKPLEEQDALDTWHEALETYLAQVLSKHRRGSPLRDELTAPYEEIAAAARESQRKDKKSSTGTESAKPEGGD